MTAKNIVFDIGGMRFRSGLYDADGRLTEQYAFDSPAEPDDIVENIQRVVESYSVLTNDPVVSIALSGMVRDGCVTSGAMHMVDYPLVERLNLRWPVVVMNDAKAAALAEATFNPRLSTKASFMLMTLSAGIGGGVIIGGDLYDGHHNIAGEVGHLIIDRGQDVYCRLGHRGCLDALASGRALNNRVRKLWREGHWSHYEQGTTLRDLPALLKDNDGMALRLAEETGKWIGEGAMQVVRILDPCEIVFKGYLAVELWDYLRPAISGVLTGYGYDVPLSLCSLGEHVGLIGAGIAAQQRREEIVQA